MTLAEAVATMARENTDLRAEVKRLRQNWAALRGLIEQDYRELRERVVDPRVARDSVELSVLQAMSRLEHDKEMRHV